MQHSLTALRAVGFAYALRLIRSLSIKVAIIIAALYIGIWYLSCSVSHWWGILAIPIGFFGLVVGILYVMVKRAVIRLSPDLDDEQRQAINRFIDKVEQVVAETQTPHLTITYRIVRDAVFKKKQVYLRKLTDESVSLAQDFNRLSKLF